MKYATTILTLLAAVAAHAHFLFVIPEAGSKKAMVVLTEDLIPGSDAGPQFAAGANLQIRGADGKDTALEMVKGEKSYFVDLPGSGPRVVHGTKNFGFRQTGTSKPHVLLYYPKTILGDPFNAARLGESAIVELVLLGKPGAALFELLANGKPLPGAEITVILPGGKQSKLKTDASGRTETIAATGRIGAWARFWEPSPGERDGKKYDELRHYATLLADVYPKPLQTATMPKAVSSFGAAESDGWLYVYGGHASPTHTYWKEAVSGRLDRLHLATGRWEELPGGAGLQGMNLLTHQGKIYRVGGMEPRNEKHKAPDNHSVASCQRFDPATRQWEDLPALPEPRSSHDLVAVGNLIIITGGWRMMGAKQTWHDTMLVMDLAKSPLQWESRPQPFRRRALIAAVFDGKAYTIGGIDPHGKVTRDVSIYDPSTGAWNDGPPLPEGPITGFAPAAAVLHGRLFLSVGDGSLYSLARGETQWRKVAESSPRVAHRMVASGDALFLLGGAAHSKNIDTVERWIPTSGTENE